MIWVDHVSGRYNLTLGTAPAPISTPGHAPAVGQLAARRGDVRRATARFYLDGVEAASAPFTGNVGNSNTWRIGAYGRPRRASSTA